MTEQHTSGPWFLDGSVSAMNLDVVYASGRIAMMECENEEISDDQLMANAHLIAAAPELLQAAKCALADLQGIMPEFEPSGDREHPAWQTIEELCAAIAKATQA